MFKILYSEFKEAKSLEKFNSLASIITISGVSLLTIFNAIGGVNLLQLAVSFLTFGFILLAVSIMLVIFLWVLKSVKGDIHFVIFGILVVGYSLLTLGFIAYSTYLAIELIKTFGNT